MTEVRTAKDYDITMMGYWAIAFFFLILLFMIYIYMYIGHKRSWNFGFMVLIEICLIFVIITSLTNLIKID